MKLRSSIICSLIALFSLSQNIAVAQQKYSLSECIDIALKQSLQLKVDNLDLAKTDAQIKQSYSSILPNININSSYQYAPQVQANIIPAETFGGPAGMYTAARLGVAQTKYATAELTQNIFNASAFIGLKSAKILVVGNQLQMRGSREDIVYNVSATYYNIQSLLKQEELTIFMLHNTDTLLTATTSQLNAGLSTQTDVDRLTVSRDNTKANLETIQNNKEKYYNLLKVLMNIPLDQPVSVNGFTDYELTTIPIATSVVDKRTNYLNLVQRKNVAELQYRNIKAGYIPTLSFFANYGLYGYYNDANPLKTINDQYYPTSALGVRLKIPVFDGFNIRYQAQQQKIEIEKIGVQMEQTIQQNEKEVADALTDMKNNLLTYQNQTRNLALAKKVLTDINQQYQSGLVKVSDVINTTNDLQTAQNNYVTALINFRQAEMNLKKAQGILLPNN